MLRNIVLSSMLALAFGAGAMQISSPNGNLILKVDVDATGTPVYSLGYKGRTLVKDSKMGLVADDVRFTDGFKVTGADSATVDNTWTPVWGEYASIRDHYNELAVKMEAQNPKRDMTLRFRVFDDGLGFRYELGYQDNVNYMTLRQENTEFNFDADHTLFCIPGDYNTDEYLWSETKFSGLKDALAKYPGHNDGENISGTVVQTPLLLKTDDGVYVSLHEAAVDGYPCYLMDVDTEKYSFKSHIIPDKLGVGAYLQLPVNTPWRTLIVSDDARDILASQMILNLNEPCKYEDTSWIKPMKFIGVWWEMFIGTHRTWAYSDDYRAKPGVTDYSKIPSNGRHPANTANVMKYIDFAAKHNIPGVLVEGWNQGWEDWGSYRKNRQFLFDKPYPDFDIDSLTAYARSKGVQLIMHHETSANAADYERQLDRAFAYMKEKGYNSVKTGYVGQIIPRSERHASQWMVEHVRHVAERAADFKIMVDSHEAPRPTGLCRTYPNWLAQESARGGEYEAMGVNPPSHTCILPFTRLKGGPMDYTPGLFETKLSTYGEGRDFQAGTTLARQLALYLTMPSPLQMACDLPENYERFPDAFAFIEEVPVDWKDSRYLEAEPNRYIVVARQDKNSDNWYMGGIANEDGHTSTVPLSFLEKGRKYEAVIYADAPDAHYKTNPQAYVISRKKVDSKTRLKLTAAPGGGYAVAFHPLPKK